MSRLTGVNWEKDQGIKELIEHLDEKQEACWDPEHKIYRIDALHRKEQALVIDEINKCQNDFTYAARNYFWIVNKRGVDLPFRLWESQELVLDHYYRLKGQGKPQKIMIIKARRLGMSTLIEGLMAWRTMLFPNQTGMVVSYKDTHSEYLFNMMLHIYEMMPWWMKPMAQSIKFEEGLIFDNPNRESKVKNPGLNSRVVVQSATQLTSAGQGYRLSCVHLSEYADWPDDKAQEIIEEDVDKAIEDEPENFGFLESTAKGSGRYAHMLWRKCVELGEKAKWTPIFLPWFFENSRRLVPLPRDWELQDSEKMMRDRISREWVRCDDPHCGTFRESVLSQVDNRNTVCPMCGVGILRAVILDDTQLAWMYRERQNASFDGESLKKLKQELCSTAEEAFQISGYPVFGESEMEFVNSTIDHSGMMEGYLDDKGYFHYFDPKQGKCYTDWCQSNHRWDDKPLRVWEFPVPGAEYVIGGDVSEGIGGKSDFSVAFINRVGRRPNPDVQVATWRSNQIDPVSFAAVLNFLGRWFNEGMMSVEVNKYDSCFQFVRYNYMYPNLFRWKHLDSTNPLSNKWGWWTNMTTKPRLWQTARKFLKDRLWVVRDPEFYEEMKTFQKEDAEDRGASAELNAHDDVIMAGMIALYTAHDLDWDETIGYINTHTHSGLKTGERRWTVVCMRCESNWQSDNPSTEVCGNKDCIIMGGGNPCKKVRASMNAKQDMVSHLDWERQITRDDTSTYADRYETFDAL